MWVLDTGATQHMTACATLLNNMTMVAPVKRVMFGNRDTLDVTGQDDLRLMVDGGPLTFNNVFATSEPRRLAEPRCPLSRAALPSRTTLLSHTALHCPAAFAATAAIAATAVTTATTPIAAMAIPTVLTFDAEGRAVDFDIWVDDLQLFLQCDSRDGVSLFDHTSGLSTAPAATADSTVRSQWTTRDAVARLAVRSHLPPAERAHFGQYKTAQSLYDAVVARYSSPTTAALSRLMLPYLFRDLAAFATVADLVAHLRTSDARYRVALPTEFCAKNPPPCKSPFTT
ncbi:unnamed protein product [Closterium sp. NIES-54]